MSRGRTLKSVEFRRERESTWYELEALVMKVERSGLGSLTAEELSRLPLLYRATLSSLGIARSISLDRNLEEYLESLCSRAYFCVYGSRTRIWHAIVDFFVRRFPAAVRTLRWHVLIATLLLLLGAAVAWAMYLDQPEFFYAFVPSELGGGRGPEMSTEGLRAVLFDDGGGSSGRLANFASFLVSHNSKIGMMCFALGIAAGLPTIYLLFKNGLTLGAFGGLYAERGLSVEFFSWILPHGVTELLAVVLCGAAGLALGEALVFPGRHDRLSNLLIRGRTAGAVMIGAVMMFFLAALIEGFFRQSVQSIPIRYAVVFATSAFWLGYFTFSGRRSLR